MNRFNQTVSKSGVSLTATLLLFCFWFALDASAQGSTNRPTVSNRWLFIVETSKGMKPRAEAAENLAARLIASGAAGQMRPDDTLGLWTFNEELHSGEFPLQDWTPQSSQTTARRAFEFLKAQPFEKEARLAKVLSEMKDVVAGSEFITVILITEGTTKIQGTPFDEKINATYAEWQEQQRKASMPFVTVLRAQGGHFTNYVVNMPPFQLEMPPLPNEILHPKVPEPKIVEPTKPPVVVPPLIISGRKPEPVPPPQEAPAEMPTNVAPVVQKPVDVVTNAPVVVSHPPAEAGKSFAPAIESESPTNAFAPAVPKLPEAKPTPAPTAEHKWIFIAAIAGALIGAAALFVAVRRGRRSSHVSLITRSLDREQK
jgi:hypothetical protein